MLSHNDMRIAEKHGKQVRALYVYEAPLRLWHWVNALAVSVLAITGYFMGDVPPTVSGEAWNQNWFGYIRLAHFAAAYIFFIGLIGRAYWAIVGNRYARQIFILPLLNKAWWGEVLFELRWYAFLERHPKKYVGHNPMAHLMMFFFFTLLSFGMCVTGFALYSEGAGSGHWSDIFFGWALPFFGGSMEVHSLHRLGMWMMMCFAVAHVYAAIREDILSQQSLVSTMISGWRMYKG